MREKKYKNRMGMFDFVKGVAIFCVVLIHTLGIWQGTQEIDVFCLIMQLMCFSLLSVFFLASGYWFSIKNVKEYAKKQSAYFIRIYVSIALLTIICYMTMHFLRFRSIRGALKGSMGVVLAYLFGSKNAISFGTLNIYDIGPAWFLVALCMGDILLSVILNIGWRCNKKLVLVVLAVVGVIVGEMVWTPYCISITLVSLICLYTGYELKHSKYLVVAWKMKDYSKMIVLAVLGFSILILGGCFLKLKAEELNIVVGIPAGILVLRAGLKIEQSCNKIVGFFKKMGRYTIWILMVHTIEMLSIDWRLIQNIDFIVKHPWIGVGIVLLLRWIVIVIGCYFIDLLGRVQTRRRQNESV